MLDRCFSDRGEGERCPICPLARAKICPEVMDRLRRLLRDSRSRDYKMSESDRQALLQETLHVMIKRVDTALQGVWDIEHVGAYTGKVFHRRRAALLRKAPRFGDWSTVELPLIPHGLQGLVTQYAGVLRLEGKVLAATALMKRSLCIELQALSSEKSWKKKIDLLYANTWKGLLENVDDMRAEYSASTAPDPEALLVQRERWHNALSPYIRLWTVIGTEQAKNCAKLFSEFGKEIISDAPGDRGDLAAALNMQENTVNKRISRCYALIHEYLINMLMQMTGEESQLCLRLFIQVYGTTRQGMGMQQRLDRAAAEIGLSREGVNIHLRRCRKLLMARIESQLSHKKQ